ncbi:MAG: thioredoxin family protein [Kiritimatiellae bacterium]|nr:thioredoxin family protein [Kiritimatiellia bacterium]
MAKKYLIGALAAGIAAFAQGAGRQVRDEGAAAGEWTHDVEAAKAYAKDSGRYLFMNFTGSDWCGWCKLMDEHVFAQPGWQAFAEDNLSLAFVDTPRDSSLVPAKYRARNRSLRDEYDVKGFPTYILFAPDGHVAGRLQAARGGTDMGFVTNVVSLIVEDRIAEFVTPEELADYRLAQEERAAWEADRDRLERDFRMKYDEPRTAARNEIGEAKLAILRRAAEWRRAGVKPNPLAAGKEIRFSDFGRGVVTNGASFGSWTCDWPAAQELAKESGKDILLAFTGPQWCDWGNAMESNVFNTAEWMDWAKDNLVLFYADCPDEANSGGLPEPILAQNATLYKKYGLQGCPFYLLATPEGERYDAFGATAGITPKAQIEAVELLLARHGLDKLAPADEVEQYRDLERREAEAEGKWREGYDMFIAEMDRMVERFKPIADRRNRLFMKAFEAYNAKKESK